MSTCLDFLVLFCRGVIVTCHMSHTVFECSFPQSYFKSRQDVKDFSGSSVTVHAHVREAKVEKGNRVWELGGEVSRDSVWAAVYSGITAR